MPDLALLPALVLVFWKDIVTHSAEWQSFSDVSPAECRSVGWLVRVTDDHIVLAATVAVGFDDVNSMVVIPRGVITRMLQIPTERRMAVFKLPEPE